MGRYTKGTKPLLSISLLVSNSIDTIRKCMESIKPLLEALPSELIVVDGGSKDGAIEIAREYADEVVPFVWCNDFSAARNAGLEKATGEWFFYLDDDEWFEDVTEIIAFFQSEEYKKYEYGWYIQRSYTNREGNHYTDVYVGRMHKLIPGLRFKGRIHESFFPASARVKQFSSYVHHYGYVFDTPELREQKSKRNISLVELEHKENPKDFRMACQLVQEYMVSGQLEEAEQLVQNMIKENPESLMHPNMQYLIVCLARIEEQRDNWEAVEEKLQYIEKTYPLDEQTKLVCLVERMIAAGFRKDYVLILKTLPDYFSLRTQIQQKGEIVTRKLIMDFCTYASDTMEQKMIITGMRAMLLCDEFSLAETLFKKINWAEEVANAEPYSAIFLREYEKNVCSDLFFYYLNDVLENPKIKPILLEKLELLLAYDIARRAVFIEQVEKFCRPEPFFRWLHIAYCMKNKGEAEIREAIDSYFAVSDGKYDTWVVADLLLEPLYVHIVLQKIDFDKLKESVTFCLQDRGAENVLATLQTQESLWLMNQKIPFLYFKMAAYEAMLFAQEIVEESLVWNYVESALAFAKAYFGESVFLENGKALPKNLQFALWMQQAAICKNAGDRVGWSERVKQAAEIYPSMIPVIQSVLRAEKEKQNAFAVSKELLQLAEQLKQQIRTLMKTGKHKEAGELVLALEQYVPQDAEVVELKELLFL